VRTLFMISSRRSKPLGIQKNDTLVDRQYTHCIDRAKIFEHHHCDSGNFYQSRFLAYQGKCIISNTHKTKKYKTHNSPKNAK
jgi:hypothetical protein